MLRSLIYASLDMDSASQEDPSVNSAVKDVRKNLLVAINKSNASKITRRHQLYRYAKIAAILFLLVSSTVLVKKHWQQIYNYFRPVNIEMALTARGERKIIQLTDGTKIWLSPSSSLKYPDQFNGKLREVKLEGEAFFEVAKDKTHPFIIHSGQMDTRVVGTSFMINAFKEQAKYTVTVVTGIVKVSSAKTQKQVVLLPNHRSEFTPADGSLISAYAANAIDMLKRKDGILTFDGTPVKVVALAFAQYYNVQIHVENKSENCLCYGEFDTRKPVNILLAQLAAAINARVVIQDNVYIIRGGCEE
ncbi:FecR family protein [Mucilaginibacter sp. X5P1]|uniref:FecR family protein n=1 Tax=Mucilaginibacter sp. X5P1 TaxID=2723088 RepID=UPI001616B82F|nr:FecR domain-containing protein [Mucilaginibacter sp. X5P1]